MSSSPPEWTAFDPAAPPPPPPAGDELGRVVALAATSEAIGRGWAPEVTVGLARAWSEQGEQILLVDAHLGAPVLHEVVGIPNAEGLSDALLYGGSVQRSAKPIDGSAFFLVTAGTVVAEPERALEPARWARLCGAFRGAGVTLVVYVPAEPPWAQPVLAQATDIIYLATPGDSPVQRLGRANQVRSVLGVWGAPLEEENADTLLDPLEALPMWVSEPADPPRRSGPGVASGPESHDSDRTEPSETEGEPDMAGTTPTEVLRPGQLGVAPSGGGPTPTGDEKSVSRLRNRILFIAGAAVLVVATVMLRSGSLMAPPEPPGPGTSELAPAAPPEVGAPETSPSAQPGTRAEAPPAATPVGPASRYSVAIGALQDLEAATTYEERLAARAGSFWFGLAPIIVNGTVFNRVLAGLSTDSLGAERMKAQISAAIEEDPRAWLVRRASLAFLLGEFDSLEEAIVRVDSVTAAGIPSYVLAVAYSDGAYRFRAYAGAYATDAEAMHLRAELSSRSLPDSLVERIGRLPR